MDNNSIKTVLSKCWNNIEDLMILSDAYIDIGDDAKASTLRQCAEILSQDKNIYICGAVEDGHIIAVEKDSGYPLIIYPDGDRRYAHIFAPYATSRRHQIREPIYSLDDTRWMIYASNWVRCWYVKNSIYYVDNIPDIYHAFQFANWSPIYDEETPMIIGATGTDTQYLLRLNADKTAWLPVANIPDLKDMYLIVARPSSFQEIILPHHIIYANSRIQQSMRLLWQYGCCLMLEEDWEYISDYFNVHGSFVDRRNNRRCRVVVIRL